MREMVSSVVAAGALLLSYACANSIEVGVEGPGQGGATTAASTSGTRSASASVGVGGTAGPSSSASSTGVGGAGATVASSSSSSSTSTTAASSSSSTSTTVASSSSSTSTTAASSSSSTGAGGGACAPAPLVGINWTGSEWQTARLDPVTGDLTVLAVIPSVESFAQGFSAYDPHTKHVYEFGDSSVYTIDGITGAVLHTVVTDISSIYNPEVNSAGQIVIVHILGAGAAETATLDPTTGAITSLAPLPEAAGYGQAECAVDSSADRIYQFGDGFLLTIDGATGATLSNVVPAAEFDNAVVNDAGELIGIDYPAHAMGRMDPATGAITTLAPFSAGVEQGIRTYDPCTDRIYQFDGFTLLVVDGTTGALLSTVTMPQQNFSNVEAVW